MSLMRRRHRAKARIPMPRLGRRRTADTAMRRLGPLARQVRTGMARRLEDVRHWAAPRLNSAARAVEAQVAPKVSRFLTATAKRIEPSRSAKARRRWPMTVLITGLALGTTGYLMYRGNTQQWADSLQESSDASSWSSTGPEGGTATSPDTRRASAATRVQETSAGTS